MRKRSTLLAAIAMVILVPGCERRSPDEGATDPEPTFTTWDSAGIEIVENHAPEHAPGEFWTFDTVPEIVLGGADDLGGPADDSDQLIWEVVGLARLEDGRIAVLSSMGKQLLLFEPSGALSRTIGRAGEGPGEFRGPEWLQYLPPDTLVVWDYFMSSISYFDTAGNLLRERRVDQARLREAGASGEAFVRPLPDGTLVVSVRGGPDSETTEYKAWNPQTSTLQTLRFGVGNYARIDDSYGTHVLGPRADITAGGNPPSIYLSRPRQERDSTVFAGRGPCENHTAYDRRDTDHRARETEQYGEILPVGRGRRGTRASRHHCTDVCGQGNPPIHRESGCGPGGISLDQRVVGFGVGGIGPVERLQSGGTMAWSSAIALGPGWGGFRFVRIEDQCPLLDGRGLLSDCSERRTGGGAGGGVPNSAGWVARATATRPAGWRE